jgi:plastocyanin
MSRCMAAVLMMIVATVFGASPAGAADRTIELQAERFAPATVTVSQGDTVTFVWRAGFHNVVFDDGASSGAPVGDAGTTYARTFDRAGTFRFVCETHLSVGMVGSVTVLAAASPSAPGGGGTGGTGTGGSAGGTTSAGGSAPVVTAYPDTGPQPSLAPPVGAALLVLSAAGWLVVARRRR